MRRECKLFVIKNATLVRQEKSVSRKEGTSHQEDDRLFLHEDLALSGGGEKRKGGEPIRPVKQ